MYTPKMVIERVTLLRMHGGCIIIKSYDSMSVNTFVQTTTTCARLFQTCETRYRWFHSSVARSIWRGIDCKTWMVRVVKLYRPMTTESWNLTPKINCDRATHLRLSQPSSCPSAIFVIRICAKIITTSRILQYSRRNETTNPNAKKKLDLSPLHRSPNILAIRKIFRERNGPPWSPLQRGALWKFSRQQSLKSH